MRLLRIRLRKLVLFSILGALLVHAGLLGLLNLGVTPPAVDPQPSLPIMLTQVEQKAGQSPVVDDRELSRKIDSGIHRLSTRTPEQNRAALRANSRWLDRHSSERAVGEIATVIRRATGDPPARAYAPAQTPPPGEFDMKSMLPYSTAKVVGKDGLERTEQTWIDKDGRTFKQTSRRQTTADGRTRYFHGAYGPDGKLYEIPTDQDPFGEVGSVLDTVAQSPLLQKLYRQAVLPLLESKRGSGKTSRNEPRP